MKKTIIKTCVLCAALILGATLLAVPAKLADDFAADVARGNMAEIALSRLALDHSQNDSVKQFAQKMIDDHTAAEAELQTIATSKNLTLPTTMDSKHQSAVDKLGARSATDFDREYMKTMVNDHEKMVGILQKEANSGTDTELKAFAAKTLPTVQSHLEMARSISSSLGNGSSGKSTNSNGMSGMNSNRSSNSNSRSNSNKRVNSNSNSNRP